MADFSQGSYVTIHFIDGTYLELKFMAHNNSYLMGTDNIGNTLLVPFTNIKYVVS